jgi:hypothetical protein
MKQYKKTVLITGAVFAALGIVFFLAGSIMGGNPIRAAANVGCIIEGGREPYDYFYDNNKNNNKNNNNSRDRYYYDNDDDTYDDPFGFDDDDIYEFFKEFGIDGSDIQNMPSSGSGNSKSNSGGTIY